MFELNSIYCISYSSRVGRAKSQKSSKIVPVSQQNVGNIKLRLILALFLVEYKNYQTYIKYANGSGLSRP